MEIKKSPQHDLNKVRPTFFMIGLIIALSIFYIALEWGGDETDDESLVDKEALARRMIKELDMIPMIKEEPKITPKMPKQDKKKAEELKVVDKKPEEAAQKQDDINLVVPEMLPEIEEHNDPISSVEMTKHQEDSVFRIVEQLPEYPGGISEFMKWLTKNLQYPTTAQRMKMQGKCVVSFIVNKDGSVSDIKVEKPLNQFCDGEAMRVMRKMPKWKPGHMKGEVVRTKIEIPIVFKM